MENLQSKVQEVLEREPGSLPGTIALELGVTEWQVLEAMPTEIVTVVSGEHAQSLLEGLVDWGNVTTIINSHGSIFEVKAPFPKGKLARGYYNLMGKEGELHGHLRLELVTNIALISKDFMGKESHNFSFHTESGDCMFKIYLGRDKKRNLIPEQVEKFKQLKQSFSK
ncbi:heme utilization cystosolic carrier protein HutX [Vibrio sp. SCSIO 43136]|uniref:heme utilization cystosolic carrier protein HutX n=1 Tax=Vibrio sp. SCSIO 43136 TaxID=2819101 RepID=UPI002074ACE3|nr:heme utilization cystosolic carrier protein HutX [Vibrio sp. SCSIO 43136]USD66795.1 heme utilization cystosolic carrier protein HutX [Vibrio sp. SCSIO 43136]